MKNSSKGNVLNHRCERAHIILNIDGARKWNGSSTTIDALRNWEFLQVGGHLPFEIEDKCRLAPSTTKMRYVNMMTTNHTKHGWLDNTIKIHTSNATTQRKQQSYSTTPKLHVDCDAAVVDIPRLECMVRSLRTRIHEYWLWSVSRRTREVPYDGVGK